MSYLPQDSSLRVASSINNTNIRPLGSQLSISSGGSFESKTKQSADSSWSLIIDDFFRFQSDTWAFEILSLLVSAIALVAAVVALNHYDGEPDPTWPFSLTLNAFIAVCMTIMVASLTVPVSSGLGQLKWMLVRKQSISVMGLDTLDRASRGMWGSICVLFGFTGGYLGVLGSIIMIVAFAAAPFGQQAISSSIGAIEHIQDPTTVVSACGGDKGLNGISLVFGLTGTSQKGKNGKASFLRRSYYSSIYGTFNRSVVSDNLAVCPTGNCTWPSFPTLSFCGKCKNVTEFLKIEKSLANLSSSEQLASLPNGPLLDAGFASFTLGMTSPSPRLESTNATIYTFAALEASNSGHIKAIECSLSLCVQSIETKYSNGVFSEKVVKEVTETELRMKLHPGSIPNTSFEMPSQLTFTVSGDAPLLSTEISVDAYEFRGLRETFEFDSREDVPLAEMGLENIPSVMENLAIAAGRGLRTVCGSSNQVFGSSWSSVSLVRINWHWFILPVAVEGLALFFFTWIVIRNNYDKSKLWKTSLVAALYHGVVVRNEASGRMEGLFNMEQVAEKMNVRLVGGEKNGRSRLVEGDELCLDGAHSRPQQFDKSQTDAELIL